MRRVECGNNCRHMSSYVTRGESGTSRLTRSVEYAHIIHLMSAVDLQDSFSRPFLVFVIDNMHIFAQVSSTNIIASHFFNGSIEMHCYIACLS